jgi:hypothetical protein
VRQAINDLYVNELRLFQNLFLPSVGSSFLLWAGFSVELLGMIAVIRFWGVRGS